MFQGRAIAWECSICGKLFSLSYDELQSTYYSDLPAYLASDFEAHSCWSALYKRAEDIRRIDEDLKENAYSSLLLRFKKQ